MSIQDKIRAGKGEVKESSKDMKKTLFIGIGGSGKEVLMRLRRKFYTSGLGKHGYDFIRYLWIDTDPSGAPISDENWNHIGENIRFAVRDTVDEVFNASIDKDALSSLYGSIDSHEHIRYWFPINTLKPLGFQALVNGAKGIRPLGRLAFSWHSNAIFNIINDNISRLDTQFATPGIKLDNNIDVYIVCSLAGGTGSGMFIELAKMLKANWINSAIYGVFFLSDMFSEKGDNNYRDANCYAALQELDFYQTADNYLDPLISRERHMFEFIDSSGSKKDFHLPLYSNVFLITNEYYKAPKEQVFSDPFEMVAEIFYYDFDQSDFGAQKRSQTVNTRICGSKASVKYILNDSDAGQIGIEYNYHSDYSSFGLSGIFLNISKMKNWSAYKYLVSIMELMLNKNKVSTDLFENPDGTFRVSSLSYDNIIHSITHGSRAFSIYDEYLENLNKKIQKKMETISDKIAFNHNTINEVQKVCTRQFEEINSFVSGERDILSRELVYFQGTPGATLSKLETNMNAGLEKVFSEIERLLYEILANVELGGINSAKAMLERIKSLLNQIETNCSNYQNDTNRLKEKLTEIMPEKPDIVIDQTINEFLTKIQDCNEIPGIFLGYQHKAKKYYDGRLSHEIDKMNGEIKQQLSKYFYDCRDIIKQRFEYNYRVKVNELVRALMAKLLDAIERQGPSNAKGFNVQLRDYEELAASLRTYFSEFEESLKTEITANISRKLILDKNINQDELFDSFLKRLNGHDWFASQITETYMPTINRQFPLNSDLASSMQSLVKILVYYNNIDSRANLPELKPKFREACWTEFSKFMENRSVVDAFSESRRQNEGQIKNATKQMLDNFNFRLALSQAYTQIKARIEGTSMVRIVGLPQPNENLEIFLKGLGDVKNITYHGSNESILFYSETFGFPLFTLKNINSLKDEFIKNIQINAGNKDLRYTDIVTDYLRPLVTPRDTFEMQNILYCWEVLYEAIILRIISYRDKVWTAAIKNPDKFMIEQNIYFGRNLESANSILASNENLVTTIKQLAYDKFADKYNSSEAIQQIYYALLFNYNEVNLYINSQFDEDKPKIPQEHILHILLQKYVEKYAKLEEISPDEAKVNLAKEFAKITPVSSGYKDSIHTKGLMTYPYKD